METCRWSEKLDDCIAQLKVSLAAAHDEDPALSEVYSYSALSAKCRRCRLGLQKALNRIDVCALCAFFDHSLSKTIENFLSWVELELETMSAGVMSDFNYEHEDPLPPRWRRCQSFQYLEQWWDYIQHECERRGIWSEEIMALVSEELNNPNQGFIQLLKEFAVHWHAADGDDSPRSKAAQ